MSGLTTRDEVEFNVRCFVGSRCHGSGRAFLEQFIFVKSFLNVVCLKVDRRVVNSQPRFSENRCFSILLSGCETGQRFRCYVVATPSAAEHMHSNVCEFR